MYSRWCVSDIIYIAVHRQVDIKDTRASKESVDDHLNMFRGALKNFNGSVEVMDVADGVCKLKYDGPPPLGNGLKAAIRDKYPDLKEIEFV